MERRGHGAVHGNEQVLLLGNLRIPLHDALLDPLDERRADDRGADVAHPLLRRLPELLVLGHERDDYLVLKEE